MIADRGNSTFREVFLQSDNQRGLCVIMLLAWLATSDGEVDGEERAILEDIARTGHNASELTLAIEHAQAGQVEDLQLACEVCRGLSLEQRKLFMQMAVGIVIADEYLTLSENHILRFLADLLGLSQAQLNELFEEAVGEPIPTPGDPGRIEWWNQREAEDQVNPQAGVTLSAEGSRDGAGMTIETAMHVLGLAGEPNAAQVQAAYDRLSRIHDPARFKQLGPEAVKTATATLKRIDQACRLLLSHG